jgi:hypothetical protein
MPSILDILCCGASKTWSAIITKNKAKNPASLPSLSHLEERVPPVLLNALAACITFNCSRSSRKPKAESQKKGTWPKVEPAHCNPIGDAPENMTFTEKLKVGAVIGS